MTSLTQPPLITVVTPTLRPEGLEIVRKSLSRQTFRGFEWLIGSSFDPKIPEAIWIEDDFKGGLWTLNRIYNKLISVAKGKSIVSWQDFVSSGPQALEKFLFYFNLEPKTLVTGVGHQFAGVDEHGEPIGQIWSDPRLRSDLGSFYPCYHNDIEFNFCSVPKDAFYAVGGFDEGADFLYLGMDHISVTHRLNDIGGWDFKIDQSNVSKSIKHGRRKDWEKNQGIHGGYTKRVQELKDRGVWPILEYLKETP